MQIEKLKLEFDKLQNIYGDNSLDPIYGAGETNKPKICLVFMNPTVKNLSSKKTWKGLKAPWISTKNIWRMLYQLGLIDKKIYDLIQEKTAKDWDYDFSEKVYNHMKSKSIYITNLSKATQVDARPLKNEVFKQYLDLFYKEIEILNPEVIITFGNQVSSIILNKQIKVGENRKKAHILQISNKTYKVFPVFYPVGRGMRNMSIAKEDMLYILKNLNK